MEGGLLSGSKGGVAEETSDKVGIVGLHVVPDVALFNLFAAIWASLQG